MTEIDPDEDGEVEREGKSAELFEPVPPQGLPRVEPPSSLAKAAEAVELELSRFVGLTAAVGKIELNSQKSLARAARSLQDALAGHERIAASLRQLVAAAGVAQQRQQVAADQLQAHAQTIEQRSTEFAELIRGLGALGQEAHEITVSLQGLAGAEPKTEGGNGHTDFAANLKQIGERLDGAVRCARDLRQRAVQSGMLDIVRQADSLHQQLAAARTKLQLPDAADGVS